MKLKTYTISKAAACAVVLLAVAGCVTPESSETGSTDFSVSRGTIQPLRTANLCTQIGGQSAQPQLTISHSPVADVPIRVRMYDVHNDGTATEHNTVRARSEADGTTVVSSGFRPPCNRTNGARNSSYRFDIIAGGQTQTVQWGGYNSTTQRITN
jgi:hypothetical protein